MVDALFKSIMLKINRSCEKRPHSSQFFGNELACELAFTLGRGRAMKEVLHLFGVSEKVIPKVDLQISYLPQSFVASRDFATMEQSCRSAMAALNVQGTRNFIVVLDETVFHPRWDVIVGLGEGYPMGYIGGFKAPDEDCSFVPSPASELPVEKLSRLTVHFVFSRADSNKQIYQVDMIPRKPKVKGSDEVVGGARQTFYEYGWLLRVATSCNSGIPPIGGAWDSGTPNSQINSAFLGLLPGSGMEVPFFNQCTKQQPLKIPMWCYRALFHQDFFVSGNNDSRHCFKRFGIHLCSGSRTIRWGAFTVNLTGMVAAGLPIRALAGDDPQSDADSSRRLNAGYCLDN